MFPEYKRKTPEEILRELEQLKRGKLKVYIGSAPGVGKTYRLLQEAHELKAEGIDVLVGLVETHNRKETSDLIRDLEIVRKKEVRYKGRLLEEMDTQAIIERNPDVVIVDELAHTNVPTSPNEKRYMDVEEILQAGINVISAVNIQHLESLHDIVEQITGIKVRERIPDHVLHEMANEVILVDVTPEILRKRLSEGKIYDKSKIEQALTNFFTDSNLGALRELSLREVADDIDERIGKTRMQNGLQSPTGVHEKIMVCVQYGGNAEKLIRRGWRIASRLKTDLFILHVSNEASMNRSQEDRMKIQNWKKLATQFNATFIVEQTDKRTISETIRDIAVENGITQIILGQSARSRWEEITKGSIVNNIMRIATGIDIHIVADQNEN
ncbi:KdpD-like non-kinase potassium sensor [Fictibacillus phosphorivorans]|uniref:KdpD-like non-kinase potassium sensor n=1 Tax=Fictibacillus phosphorivorans TaxID=1221500 RepID=UPI001293D548|nr:KdpD-like non-kinase potassium sensor [Fictibacillus phosphorivorans]MQR97006.1 sensor histidine kinase KdpD [Fictibacillus phosphorivorans]